MAGIGKAIKGLGLLAKKKKGWKKSEHMGWTKKEVEIEMGDRSLMNPSKKISKKYKKGVAKKASVQTGWGAHLKRRSRVFKEGQERHKALDLKEIHDKYFDKSGMKQKGKDVKTLKGRKR